MLPNRLRILSDEEMKFIDAESRLILEDVGVRVFHDESLDMLAGIGCKVDKDTKLVKMPSHVVQKAIDTTASQFSLYGIDPSFRIDIGKDNVYFGPGGFSVFAEDLDGVRHTAVREDFINCLRLSEKLDSCEFNHVNVNAMDIPKSVSDLYMWADSFTYQSKPIMNENFSKRSVLALMEMGAVIRGSQKAFLEKPFACLDVCIVSPLTHDERQVNLILAAAEYGLPVSIESGPIGGATSPVTLAAVATQANAELLSALVIAYAKKPGIKMMYGSWGRHLDMRSALVTMGGPEYGMLKITTAQMGKYYNLPTRGGGALSDSLIPDAQAGYEKMITTLIPALARVNYISGMGLNETENCFSPAQLVIDDEIVKMTKRVLSGITVDSEHVAADVITEVGPGGQFLDSEHTFEHFKSELFSPQLSFRGTHATWVSEGKRDARQRAAAKAGSILAGEPEMVIEKKQADELIRIVHGVEKELEK